MPTLLSLLAEADAAVSISRLREIVDALNAMLGDTATVPGSPDAKAIQQGIGKVSKRIQVVKAQQAKDKKRRQEEQEADPTSVHNAARADIQRAHDNEYLSDSSLRKRMGTSSYHKVLAGKYKAAGVDIPADTARGRSGVNPITGLEIGAIVGGIGASVNNGKHIGDALSSVGGGLAKGIGAAGAGFVAAGEAALGLFLSPFGRSGSAITHAVGGLLGGISGVLGAGGKMVGTGAKALVTGAAGLAGGVIGAGGALAGGVIGGALTGGVAGVIPGALIGAGIGAAVTGLISSVVGTLSTALGALFSAVGEAAGAAMKAVGTALGSVKEMLSDLVGTAGEFAKATASISRAGGLSLGQAGQASSFAQVVTGSPSGLNGYFSNFAHNAAYAGGMNSAFGIHANANDPLSTFAGGYAKWQQSGPLQREILLRGRFGGASDSTGALYSAGPQAVAMAVKTARETAMTPREAQQSLMLGFQMNGVIAQVDKLKISLLENLMPTIQMVVGAASHLLSANAGKLNSTFQSIGHFFFVDLPGLITTGLTKTLDVLIAASAAFPKVFNTALMVITGGLSMMQSVAGIAGRIISHFNKPLGHSLEALGDTDLLTPLGLTGAASKPFYDKAKQKREEADEIAHKYGTHTPTPGDDGRMSDDDIQTGLMQVKRKQLQKEAADLEAQGRAASPLGQAGLGANIKLGDFLTTQKNGLADAAQGLLGSTSSREGEWEKLRRSVSMGIADGNQKPHQVSVSVGVEQSPENLYRFSGQLAYQNANQTARAIADAL